MYKIKYYFSFDIVQKNTIIVYSYFYTIMIYLQQTFDILTGGMYMGNLSWNSNRAKSDNCFKVYLLTEGNVYICDEKQDFSLQKNKLYFINGYKLTQYYCKQSFSTLWLHFIPKDLIVHQGLSSLPLIVELPNETNKLFGTMPNIEKFISNDFTSYQEYILELFYAQIFLQSFICCLFEQYPIEKSDFSTIKRIQPAIRHINKHFTEPIRLEQLADICCMSPNYFHKIFTKALNTTPSNYISLLRMNTALQLLACDKYTIQEVAYELGFTDNAYFCRVFKKHYGITPGEYKKKRGEILF